MQPQPGRAAGQQPAAAHGQDDDVRRDRELLEELQRDGRLPDDGDIFTFIVDLARAIGATTVVEGVETVAQAALVTALGCDRAQGYLVSRPLTERDTAAFLGLDPAAG